MKERISGLRNESSKTKRTGLFQRMKAAFFIQIDYFPTKSLCILAHKCRDRRDYGILCSPRNDPKMDRRSI